MNTVTELAREFVPPLLVTGFLAGSSWIGLNATLKHANTSSITKIPGVSKTHVKRCLGSKHELVGALAAFAENVRGQAEHIQDLTLDLVQRCCNVGELENALWARKKAKTMCMDGVIKDMLMMRDMVPVIEERCAHLKEVLLRADVATSAYDVAFENQLLTEIVDHVKQMVQTTERLVQYDYKQFIRRKSHFSP